LQKKDRTGDSVRRHMKGSMQKPTNMRMPSMSPFQVATRALSNLSARERHMDQIRRELSTAGELSITETARVWGLDETKIKRCPVYLHCSGLLPLDRDTKTCPQRRWLSSNKEPGKETHGSAG